MTFCVSCREGAIQQTSPPPLGFDEHTKPYGFESLHIGVAICEDTPESLALPSELVADPFSSSTDPIRPPSEQDIWIENDQEYCQDFFGDFTVVASCWDGKNLVAWDMTGEIERSLHPSTAIGLKVSYGENTCTVNDIERLIPSYTSYYDFSHSGGGHTAASIMVHSDLIELVLSLDLSEKYRSRWEDDERSYITVYLSDTEFPREEQNYGLHSNTMQAVQSLTILDEDHLILGRFTWDVLAIRDSHLDEGCNYLTCHDLTTEFCGDAYRLPSPKISNTKASQFVR